MLSVCDVGQATPLHACRGAPHLGVHCIDAAHCYSCQNKWLWPGPAAGHLRAFFVCGEMYFGKEINPLRMSIIVFLLVLCIEPQSCLVISQSAYKNERDKTVRASISEIMQRTGTPKLTMHSYDRYYSLFLEEFRDMQGVRILEIAADPGKSLNVFLFVFFCLLSQARKYSYALIAGVGWVFFKSRCHSRHCIPYWRGILFFALLFMNKFSLTELTVSWIKYWPQRSGVSMESSQLRKVEIWSCFKGLSD